MKNGPKRCPHGRQFKPGTSDAGLDPKSFVTYRPCLAPATPRTVGSGSLSCWVDIKYKCLRPCNFPLCSSSPTPCLFPPFNIDFLNAKQGSKQTPLAMLHSLIWAIWALSTSPSAAERPARLVKWEDLMVATSAFPRFSGEVANITRTGTPKVAAVLFNSGAIEPITCRSNAEGLHCDADCGDCGDVAAEFPNAINELQLHSPPQLDGLTFIGNRILSDKKEDGTKCRSFFLWQSNPAGKIPIDNTVVQINLVS